MKNQSLSFKMMIGGTIAMLVPLLFIGTFSIHRSSDALETLSQSQSVEVAKGLAHMANLAVREEMKIASQIALSSMVI